MPDFLLCTDLDRTLLPNGLEPESPPARPLLHHIASRDDVHLAYVTGRDRRLVEEAIAAYDLPTPDWVIGDVGTSLYRLHEGRWDRTPEWDERLTRCWRGLTSEDLAPRLEDLRRLTLQESSKQGRHKLSFYHPLEEDVSVLGEQIRQRLNDDGIASCLVFSIDEAAGVGLLDILPEMADKLRALRFLMERHAYRCEHTLFAGDSGNDLPVLASEIPSVIVANARPEVIGRARMMAAEAGTAPQLYVAAGGFRGMNGNYGAGILEGLAHFHPNLVGALP